MRVRGAGGLLVGIALYPVALTLDSFTRTGQGIDWDAAARSLLWYPEGASPPAHSVAFILLRDALLVGSLVVGVLGVAGLRGSRIPVALAGAGIALGSLPFIIYDPFDFTSSPPPDWVFEDQLWFPSGRWAGVLWFGVAVAVIVLAATDTARREMTPFGVSGSYGAPPVPGGPVSPSLQGPPSHWAPAPPVPPSAAPAPAPAPTPGAPAPGAPSTGPTEQPVPTAPPAATAPAPPTGAPTTPPQSSTTPEGPGSPISPKND